MGSETIKRKTAYIIGGSSYNVKNSLQSQLENLIIPNDADVFIVTTRACRRRKTPESAIPLAEENDKWNAKNATTVHDLTPLTNKELQLIKDTFGDRLKGLYVAEEMPDYAQYLIWERVKMMNKVNTYIGEGISKGLPLPLRGHRIESIDNGNVRCVVDQYRHIRKAYEFMEEYENKNGFKYEYVIRARIDFIVPEPIVIEHYTQNHDEPYLYVMGSVRRDEFCWSDEFCFFAKRQVAGIIFPALDRMGLITNRKMNTLCEPENNDLTFDPECQFDLLLHELNLQIINVRIYRSARYTNGGDGWDYMNYQFRRDKPIDLDYEYELVCKCKTDINEHLPTLVKYAKQCDHITELGTRFANSTTALMYACKGSDKKFVAYDPQWSEKMGYMRLIAAENNIDFEMKIMMPVNEDHSESIIEPTDFLFIDTNHNVESITEDITLHSPRCRKFMVLHDSVSFWERGQGYDNGGGGMKLFLEPFIENSKEWKLIERHYNNNGLLVFERVN